MEHTTKIVFKCVEITQPIGSFYVGVLTAMDLKKIVYYDIRRVAKREVEEYTGIQRDLKTHRVKEIKEYVTTRDACFPTGVILAISGEHASYDRIEGKMTLSHPIDSNNDVEQFKALSKIAKILDGQHRIAGLEDYVKDDFQVCVTIFIDMDMAEQATLFSTVNFTQTKVNKSHVYDLYALAKTRSPQKLSHEIAVMLDSDAKSPLFEKIKRLGKATSGRYNESITQATFVSSLLKYLTPNEVADRDKYRRGERLEKATSVELRKYIFRNMMIEEQDFAIAENIWNYFEAVSKKWPTAWKANGQGDMLRQTNGFRALMRFLRDAYLFKTSPGSTLKTNVYLDVLNRIKLTDNDFTTDNYLPGTSGESRLYNDLIKHARLPAASTD